MKEISDFLGHSDISTTINLYSHVNMNAKNRMIETLSAALSL